MGPKQSSPAASGRVRAYSGSDLPSSGGGSGGGSSAGSAAVLRYYSGGAGTHASPQRRLGADGRPTSLIQSAVIPSGGGTPRHGETDREPPGPRLLIGSLPVHLSPHLLGAGFHCPVCSKFVASDEMDLHLVMCLTKPRLTYNEDVLTKDSGECAVCLEDLLQGDTIARLPCLCIYHKGCIDEWFEVNRSCPEHPTD
ncbi:E3 ubiquitin-protein ligase znrf2-like [Hoplias malabaricus]|uniref:E3 ubiquitin-protein ligase znrf2-like n=1 Tax=Hoplias malabaricus TaxID=27720 RepID=UPI003461AF40